MKTSKGEEKIIELLNKERLKFEREKRFKDLKHGLYRFDFYVHGAHPCVIEYNGEGHYHFIPKFHKRKMDLDAYKERDRRKISYCLANQIPIYIIPYWEINNIHSAKDIFQDKFRARDRWKNDTDFEKYHLKQRHLKEFDRLFGNLL